MKKFRVTVNGNTYEVDVEELSGVASSQSVVTSAPVAPVTPVAAKAPVAAPKKATPASAGANKVVAPMPGKILDIKVSEGQSVSKGTVLAILEAMKMENEIVAPANGTVAGVHVSKGQGVESGDLLISLN